MNNEFIKHKFFIGNLHFLDQINKILKIKNKVQDSKLIGQFVSCLSMLSKNPFNHYGQKEVTPYQL